MIKEKLRRAQAFGIKTKFELGKVRKTKFNTDEREIMIEYTDKKRRYIYNLQGLW